MPFWKRVDLHQVSRGFWLPERVGGRRVYKGLEGVDILNNTLFSVIFLTFSLPVGGVAVEFKGYRKHFSPFFCVFITIIAKPLFTKCTKTPFFDPPHVVVLFHIFEEFLSHVSETHKLFWTNQRFIHFLLQLIERLVFKSTNSEGADSRPRNLSRSAQSWEMDWSFWSAKFRGIET